jgi:hypothetical protein
MAVVATCVDISSYAASGGHAYLASGESRTYPLLLAPGFQREVREISETQSLLRHSGDRRRHGFASGETSRIASERTDARYAMRLDAFSYDEQTRGHLSVYGPE